MTKYMHLLEGRPAYYDGHQVCFAQRSMKVSEMCDSLYQIKKEWEKGEQWRIDQGFAKTSWRHTHIIIKFEE